MIRWFARNDVAANLMMISIIVMGLVAAIRYIPLEVFPTFETNQIQVSVTFPGATPEDVEQGVSIRVEEAVQDLEGIKKLTTKSAEGQATTSIEVDDGYDARNLLNDVKTRIDGISTFPDDIERPIIELVLFEVEVITVIVAGTLSELEMREFADEVYTELGHYPGVSNIDMDAVRDYEITVEVAQDRLRALGLEIEDVAEAIGRASLDRSAGNLRTAGGDVLVRLRNQAYRRDDFERIVVRSDTDGGIIRVGDVATVRDDFEERNLRIRYNGMPAYIMSVKRTGDQSAIGVAEAVKRYLKEKSAVAPRGVTMAYWDDNSSIVKKRLGTLLRNALQGGILVILLLSLFLRPNVAFWVFLGIPVSFTGTLIAMWLIGVSLNIISLFAFILVLGVVVDDAIVTGENIYRRIGDYGGGLETSVRGTREVAVPVTFGVLTTIVAFAPMIMLQGSRSEVFAQIPVVVIFALLFSLVESKLVLPAHMKGVRAMPKVSEESNPLLRFQNRFSTGLTTFAKERYRPFLALSIRYRYVCLLSFACALALIMSLVASGWMKFIYFPRVDSEEVSVGVKMPTGTPLPILESHVRHIAEQADKIRDKYVDPGNGRSIIKHVIASVGASVEGESNEYQGEVVFELYPPEERELKIGSNALIAEWREMIGDIPGAESVSYRAELGRGGEPIEVQFNAADLDTLKAASAELRDFLAGWDGVFAITDDLTDGKEELRMTLLPEAYLMGLSEQEVAAQVRNAIYGYEVQRVQRGREDIKVKVRLPPDERATVPGVRHLMIRTADGRRAPLESVARLEPTRGPNVITRINRYRTASVTADIDKNLVNMPQLRARMELQLAELARRYPGLNYGFEGELLEQAESLQSMRYGLLFTLFAIYCLLAIPFASYVQPLIVMSVIPFGLIGAISGHLLMGMDLSMMSILGCLALVGVLVNDSLVLVDFINQHRGRGRYGRLRGLMRAGVIRLRPVLLTSMTTFIGLLPLLFDRSTQAQFLAPMAISLGFGILFATFVTLLLVPCNYMILEDIIAAFRRFRAGELRRRRANGASGAEISAS